MDSDKQNTPSFTHSLHEKVLTSGSGPKVNMSGSLE